ncbi:hypothetical protein BD779DRAFT_1432134 [Infundibulicybe gibba]|nr:hypothetical protein BD779DRAFT_1432134 [Infundibulicybe gibba]
MISPNASVVNVNQLVDPELLFGVSIGFMAPSMTNDLTPMQGVMPNIISLPYGRCPPLHLQAPSWRHLLKLMARLSATRLEPTVEAMAVSKTELKLRTVIQFVKPHHGSLDWRAVLWFTVDHPVPLALPGATKFTNGDVNVLPWSYTLSALPTLLRDGGVDTAVSKIYSIPATDSMPYPALPITFPNLAMYLQAALEDSRRFANDSSSGMRKLARMVETCYPMDVSSEPQERGSVGGLFKRVIGRGNKNAKKSRGGGNADTYELVTPFVLDEWG